MARSYGNMDDIDEGDLDAELEALGDELDELDEEGVEEEEGTPAYLVDAESEATLPSAPSKIPESESNVDEFGLPTPAQ